PPPPPPLSLQTPFRPPPPRERARLVRRRTRQARDQHRLEGRVGQRLEEAQVGEEEGVAPVVGEPQVPRQVERDAERDRLLEAEGDRKSTRLNSSHGSS